MDTKEQIETAAKIKETEKEEESLDGSRKKVKINAEEQDGKNEKENASLNSEDETQNSATEANDRSVIDADKDDSIDADKDDSIDADKDDNLDVVNKDDKNKDVDKDDKNKDVVNMDKTKNDQICDEIKKADKESVVDKEIKLNISKDEINDGEVKNIFKAKIDSVTTTNENIFFQKGQRKENKKSSFLDPNFVKNKQEDESKSKPQGETKKTQDQDSKSLPEKRVFKATLSYLDEDEWIYFDKGEIILDKKRFIFVGKTTASVLLNFEYKEKQFTEAARHILFEAQGRKSNGEGFVLVTRKYQIVFSNAGDEKEFLSEIKQ